MISHVSVCREGSKFDKLHKIFKNILLNIKASPIWYDVRCQKIRSERLEIVVIENDKFPMVNLKSQQPKFHLFYLSPLKTSLKLCFINRNNLWKKAENQSKHLRTRNKRIIFLNFKMKYKQVQRQNCFIVVAEMINKLK